MHKYTKKGFFDIRISKGQNNKMFNNIITSRTFFLIIVIIIIITMDIDASPRLPNRRLIIK